PASATKQGQNAHCEALLTLIRFYIIDEIGAKHLTEFIQIALCLLIVQLNDNWIFLCCSHNRNGCKLCFYPKITPGTAK
ncbi:MAG: hypothetical protein PUD88_03680, partial [Prevotellaceae bacterium]|nr:hypothetical protein [Prevotellaceae bacterium]